MKLVIALLVVAAVVLFVLLRPKPDVSAEEARQLLSQGARLVDVRSPQEFAAGHIDGAINIPVGEIASRLAELEPKDAGVVVYCQSGMRSARAAKFLREHGFSKTRDLGSIGAW
jgi:rhodanese-related sulfurtransferase